MVLYTQTDDLDNIDQRVVQHHNDHDQGRTQDRTDAQSDIINNIEPIFRNVLAFGDRKVENEKEQDRRHEHNGIQFGDLHDMFVMVVLKVRGCIGANAQECQHERQYGRGREGDCIRQGIQSADTGLYQFFCLVPTEATEHKSPETYYR